MRKLIPTIAVVLATALIALALAAQGGARSVESVGCSSALPRGRVVLTGTWTSTDGQPYYLRQKGNCLWWVGGKARSNVFFGSVVGSAVTGVWADVFADTSGTLTLSLETSGRRLLRRSSTGSLFPTKILTRR